MIALFPPESVNLKVSLKEFKTAFSLPKCCHTLRLHRCHLSFPAPQSQYLGNFQICILTVLVVVISYSTGPLWSHISNFLKCLRPALQLSVTVVYSLWLQSLHFCFQCRECLKAHFLHPLCIMRLLWLAATTCQSIFIHLYLYCTYIGSSHPCVTEFITAPSTKMFSQMFLTDPV